MPELPETETIARDLHDAIAGSTIASVVVLRGDVLRECSAPSLAESVRDARIARVFRRAKLIVLELHTIADILYLAVQPRFTGGLIIQEPPATVGSTEVDYVAVTFVLHDERRVHYRDVRRLGTVSLMSAGQWSRYNRSLGPEPLDPTLGAEEFSGILRGARASIKSVLMDQRRIAGVGNIYANESLWRAGIDPSRAAASLSPADADRLLTHLKAVLTESIAARGTSFRDYRDARGQRGSFVERLAVYGREGLPCPRCGRRLVGTHAVDKRSTVFCASCQR